MTHSVTLLCRVDSLSDKKHLDNQVSTILNRYKGHFKGRKSQITADSDLERKYVFHKLSADDASRLKSIATENRAQLCMKTAVIDSGPSSAPSSAPSSPFFKVPSPTVSLGGKTQSSISLSSVSSSTKSLVLNFGVDATSPSSAQTSAQTSARTSSTSFFSSASDSDSDSSTSDTGSVVGVGTSVTTPEILLLRELAEIMNVSSVKPTPSQIGKAVGAWFVTEKVQNVMRRII